MEEEVNSIVKSFPDHEKKIQQLFLYDETFRDLCADYIMCAGRAKELKADLKKNHEKIEEYEDLQNNLEEEILNFILVKKQ